MEDLAVMAAIAFLCVALSGPAAALLSLRGWVFTGGTLGVFGLPIGLWWAYVMSGPVAYVGILSAAACAWAILQAWRAGSDNV